MSSLSNQLTKLRILLDSIEEQNEEAKRLTVVLGKTSTSDQILLNLSTCYNILKKAEIDLLDLLDLNDTKTFDSSYRLFTSNKQRYDKIYNQLKQQDIDVKSYSYDDTKLQENIKFHKLTSEPSSALSPPQLKRNKSVRFKDNLIEGATTSSLINTPMKPYRDNPDENAGSEAEDELKNQLFTTSSKFSPYTDDVSLDETNKDDLGDLNNSQIFITNQQELLNQDAIINTLSKSVQQQRTLGVTIGEEIDGHMILLDDLEQGIERQDRKITRARNVLGEFRENLAKNGDWFTIFFLIIILLLLLVVLK